MALKYRLSALAVAGDRVKSTGLADELARRLKDRCLLPRGQRATSFPSSVLSEQDSTLVHLVLVVLWDDGKRSTGVGARSDRRCKPGEVVGSDSELLEQSPIGLPTSRQASGRVARIDSCEVPQLHRNAVRVSEARTVRTLVKRKVAEETAKFADLGVAAADETAAKIDVKSQDQLIAYPCWLVCRLLDHSEPETAKLRNNGRFTAGEVVWLEWTPGKLISVSDASDGFRVEPVTVDIKEVAPRHAEAVLAQEHVSPKLVEFSDG